MGRPVPKMSALVVSAIRNLREVQGSTSKEIMNYIMSQCNSPDQTIQRQVNSALKRGLEYGVLRRQQGYYSLNTIPPILPVQNAMPTDRARKVKRKIQRKGRRIQKNIRRKPRTKNPEIELHYKAKSGRATRERRPAMDAALRLPSISDRPYYEEERDDDDAMGEKEPRSDSKQSQRSQGKQSDHSLSKQSDHSLSKQSQRSQGKQSQRSQGKQSQHSLSKQSQRSQSKQSQRSQSKQSQRSQSKQSQRSRSRQSQHSGDLSAQSSDHEIAVDEDPQDM